MGKEYFVMKNPEIKARIERADQRWRDAFEFKKVDDCAHYILSRYEGYWGNGKMPADYYQNPQSQFEHQMDQIMWHLENIDDDYFPAYTPFHSNCPVPAALGAKIRFFEKEDPTIDGYILQEPEDIKKLTMPDWTKDGICPDVLKFIDYARQHTDISVGPTYLTGPLGTAALLCGIQNLSIWMYEEPELVHELLEFLTEAIIQWVKVLKEHSRMPMNADDHCSLGVHLPDGVGGIFFGEDDAVPMSPWLYEEFVVPCNSRIFETFGGGAMHFCGNGNHLLESLTKIKGLRGIQNNLVGDFEHFKEEREVLKANGIVLILGEQTPVHPVEYYKRLAECLEGDDRVGLVLGTWYRPELGLLDTNIGKHVIIGKEKMMEVLKETFLKV